jgi:hypothetical protein
LFYPVTELNYLFIYDLFNDIVSSSDYIVSDDRMKSEKWIEKEGSSCDQFKILTDICLEGLRKTTKNHRIADLWAEILT